MAGLCTLVLAVGPSEAGTHAAGDVARPTVPATNPSQLRVVALGDSVTDGTNCGCVPFPQLYAAALGDRYGVAVQISNDGLGGATSADVLTGLETDSAVVQSADVVVVTVGANDFLGVSDDVLTASCGGDDRLACTRGGLVELQHNLEKVITTIKGLHREQPATVLLTGYWNVYEDGNVADADYSAAGRAASLELTAAVNRVIKATADATQATYVDLSAPFKGAAGDHDATPLLADDGDHPNSAGHRVIAQALLAAGLPRQLPRGH